MLHDSIEPSLTIAEFRAVERISHSSYFAMRKRGEGPDELRSGRLIRITREAHRRWRKRRTVLASKATSTVSGAA
jgi:hypothetical protein